MGQPHSCPSPMASPSPWPCWSAQSAPATQGRRTAGAGARVTPLDQLWPSPAAAAPFRGARSPPGERRRPGSPDPAHHTGDTGRSPGPGRPPPDSCLSWVAARIRCTPATVRSACRPRRSSNQGRGCSSHHARYLAICSVSGRSCHCRCTSGGAAGR